MKVFIILGLVLVSAGFAVAEDDPCLDALKPIESEISTCTLDGSCSKKDRVYIACEMREKLIRRYSLFHEKDRLLSTEGKPFSTMGHLNGCINREKTIESESDPLLFEDRLRECLAGLKDSHLSLDSPVPAPNVYLGFSLVEIEGKFYIDTRYTPLIKFLRDSHELKKIEEILAIGNEVLAIDAVPVTEARDGLKKYISASSDAFAAFVATEKLTERNFAFPSKRSTEIKVKTPKGETSVILPWWTHPNRRRDISATLRSRGIISSELIRWTYNQSENKWEYGTDLAVEGYLSTSTILAKSDEEKLKSYFKVDSSGSLSDLIYRLGTVTLPKARAVGYLQILSFQALKVASNTSPKDVKDFVGPIEELVTECKEKNLEIIIDLRRNGGGELKNPGDLFGLFEKKAGKAPRIAMSFRINPHTQRMLLRHGAFPDEASRTLDQNEIEPLYENSALAYDAFETAVRNKQKHSEILLGKPTHVRDSGPFEGQVVVLISPTCVSACDLTAAMFKRSGRATLIGTPSNGTGAGYAETDFATANAEDSNNFLRLRIPNFLFGVAEPGFDTSLIPFEENKKKVLTENSPIAPDITYQLTLDEVLGKKHGWLEKVTEHLFKGN